jgi:hypothetical protein
VVALILLHHDQHLAHRLSLTEDFYLAVTNCIQKIEASIPR